MRWDEEQDDIIRAYGSLGVEGVREALLQAGCERTEGAIRMRASRICASLARYSTCPMCGARRRSLNRDGVCDVCARKALIAQHRVRNRELLNQLAQEHGEGYAAADRRYNAIRARNRRLQNKLRK